MNQTFPQVERHQALFWRRLVAAAMQTTTLLGLAALILANITLAIYFNRQERKEIDAARLNASNLTTAFEQHTVRAIRNIDQALLFARAELERDPKNISLDKLATRDYFPNDMAIQLALIGADGWMRSSTLQTSGPVDLSDREHFRVHRFQPKDELFISQPVLGRVSNVWTIQFTRKLRDANGQFAGVLVASVDPRLLSRLYDSIDIGKAGAITLWGTDGVVRARSGVAADALGHTFSPPLVAQVLAGATAGSYTPPSVFDGVQRITSFSKIENYPLVVSVELGTDEILSEFLQSKFSLQRLMILLDAAFIMIMGLGTLEKYRLNTTRENLDAQARILVSTLANMQEGILMVDAEGQVLAINDQALELLDLERGRVPLPIAYAKLPLLRYEEKLGGALQERLEIEYRSGRILEVRTSPLSAGGFVKTLSDITARRHDQNLLMDARDRAETASRARTAFLATMSHEIRTPLAGIVSMADLIASTELDVVQRRYIEITRDSAEHLLALLSDVLDVTKLDADEVRLEAIPFDLLRELRSALDILSAKAMEKGLPIGCVIAPDVPRDMTGDPSRLRQILLNLLGNAIKFTQAGHVLIDVSRSRDGDNERILIKVEDTGIGIAHENLRNLFRDFSQIDSSISRRFGGTGLGLAISRKLVLRMGGTIGVQSELGKGSTFFFEIPLKEFSEPAAFVREDAAIAIAIAQEFERNLILRQLLPAYAQVAAFDHLEDARAWLASADAKRRILLTDTVTSQGCKSFQGEAFDAYLLCARQDFIAHEHATEMACAGLVQMPVFLDDVRDALGRRADRRVHMSGDEPVSPLAGKLSGLRVLLAEDNATNQFALRRMLENMGAEVTPAKDGREAVNEVRARAFDVIVMDVMMPELDGLAAARVIRAMDTPSRATPMVALTASAFAEDREAAFAAGMNAYATKPITARGLLESIESCLKKAPILLPKAESMTDLPDILPLDRKFLDQMAEDLGPQNLSQALDIFFADLGKRADALRQEGEDADRLRKAAHAIKGSAASFGFLRVAHVAAELETAARLGETARLSELKDALLREADAAPDHLKAA